MNLHPRSHQTRPCFSCASGCPCWGSRQQRHHSMLPISSPFQSKLHPKSKTKPPSAMINQHVCASKIKSHRLSTTITALVEWCCSTAAITDQTKQQDRVKMKPRHQTRQQGGRVRETGTRTREREEEKMPIVRLSWKWQKNYCIWHLSQKQWFGCQVITL